MVPEYTAEEQAPLKNEKNGRSKYETTCINDVVKVLESLEMWLTD